MRSTAQGGGNVVTSNLVLYLDAMNLISYDGNSTLWKDLSGNKNNFTLLNSPNWDGIGFNFNGSSQYAQCVNTTCGNFGNGSFTIEYVGKYQPTGVGTDTMIIKRGTVYSISVQNLNGWADRPGAPAFFVQDDYPGNTAPNNSAHAILFGNTMPTASIYNATYTFERNGLDITGSRYINGTFTTISKKTFIGTGLIDNSYPIQLMNNSSGNPTSGSLYIIRLYNKALTPDEVLRNYNATKDRFGI
jgi:hypothetical protein